MCRGLCATQALSQGAHSLPQTELSPQVTEGEILYSSLLPSALWAATFLIRGRLTGVDTNLITLLIFGRKPIKKPHTPKAQGEFIRLTPRGMHCIPARVSLCIKECIQYVQRVRKPHRGQSPSSVTQLPILTALHARSPTLFALIIHEMREKVNSISSFSQFWLILTQPGHTGR